MAGAVVLAQIDLVHGGLLFSVLYTHTVFAGKGSQPGAAR